MFGLEGQKKKKPTEEFFFELEKELKDVKKHKQIHQKIEERIHVRGHGHGLGCKFLGRRCRLVNGCCPAIRCRLGRARLRSTDG